MKRKGRDADEQKGILNDFSLNKIFCWPLFAGRVCVQLPSFSSLFHREQITCEIEHIHWSKKKRLHCAAAAADWLTAGRLLGSNKRLK
jgi:hypothetical protein